MPAKTKIEQIMTKGVFSVTLDDTLQKADEIMREEKIRHLPVVDDGKLVGLITERKLMEYSLRQIYEYDDTMGEVGRNKISDYEKIMAKNVRVIYPEDSVLKAVELMAKYKVDCLPVVDWEHQLVGIITSVDVMLFVHKKLMEDFKQK